MLLVGARAVAYVVQHPRRRTAVTWRTSAIATGNAVVPRLLDWFVARTGAAPVIGHWLVFSGNGTWIRSLVEPMRSALV